MDNTSHRSLVTLSAELAGKLVSDTDAVVSAAIKQFIALDHEKQRNELGALLERLAGPGQVRTLLARVAASSPDAIEFIRVVRARAIEKHDGWAGKPLDKAAEAVLATLYGPAMTRLHQLSVAGGAIAETSRDRVPPSYEAVIADLTRQAQLSETVHKTADDNAFRFKFGHRRVVYALSHVALPSELVAVLYVALAPRLVAGMQNIDATSGGDPGAAGKWTLSQLQRDDQQNAQAAIFYSVGSGNSLTRGLGMGRRIIYSLAGEIASSQPSVKTFATLSPIPEFLRWMKLLTPAQLQSLLHQYAAEPTASGTLDVAATAQLLQSPDFLTRNDGAVRISLEPQLAWLCRHYLTRVRHSDGSPSCRVAAFHLSNGARMHRICANADTSEAGIKRSAGFMVNYLYSDGGIDGLRETMMERAPAYAANPAAVTDSMNPTTVRCEPWAQMTLATPAAQQQSAAAHEPMSPRSPKL